MENLIMHVDFIPPPCGSRSSARGNSWCCYMCGACTCTHKPSNAHTYNERATGRKLNIKPGFLVYTSALGGAYSQRAATHQIPSSMQAER